VDIAANLKQLVAVINCPKNAQLLSNTITSGISSEEPLKMYKQILKAIPEL
jgi:hypothetical protein